LLDILFFLKPPDTSTDLNCQSLRLLALIDGILDRASFFLK
jgi:hypothetical protein